MSCSHIITARFQSASRHWSHPICSATALALLPLSSLLFAQAVPAPSSSSGAGEEELVLTPFVVDGTKDTGYNAQNTLGGTRLNTSLSDTAAAISVFTRELLDDMAVTNLREANEYALNVVNDYGDSALQLSTNGNSFSEAGDQEIRVRGLNRTTFAINYFEAVVPSDGYNLTRLDFSRGPNSVLFGMGSPSGIINATTKQARVGSRPKTELRLRGDSNGGTRFELDRADSLVPGHVAYRLVALREDRETWRVNEGRTQQRVFGSLHWKVNPRLSFRLEGETGKIAQRQGRPWSQLDLLFNWEALGSQTYDNLRTDGSHVAGSTMSSIGIGSINGTDRPFVVYDANRPTSGYSMRNVGRPNALSTDVQFSYPADTTFRTLPRDANLVGDLGRGSAEFRALSAFVELNPVRNLYVELAANRQQRSRVVRDLDWPQYGLQVDVNRYELLLNGAGARVPNPRLGDYYLETDMWLRDQFAETKSCRLMASYELQLGKWFGTHRLGLLGERNLKENSNINYREYLLDNPATPGVELMAASARSGDNILRRRIYIDDRDIGTNRPSMSGLSANTEFDSSTTFPVFITPNMAANAPIRQGRAIGDQVLASSGFRGTSGSIGKSALDSQMAVIQNNFIGGRLITVFGYRKDEASVRTSETYSPTEGPQAGFLLPRLVHTPKLKSGNTRTFGLLLRPLKPLTLFYNRSTNFNLPSGTALVFNQNLDETAPDMLPPVEKGEGRDFGIKLDLWSGKIFLTASQYKTEAKNSLRNSGGSYYSSRANTIWTGLNDAGLTLPAPLTSLLSSQSQVLSSGVADGHEFEVVANLLPGWRLMANYSRSKTVAANIGTELRAYFDKWRPLWAQHPDVPLSFPLADQDTVGEMIDRIYTSIKADFLSQENTKQRGQSEHRANLRTNYSFTKGSLSGFSVGGGARYRSAPITAHITLTDAKGNLTRNDVIRGVDSFVADFNASYHRRLFSGKVGWHVQLNVNNCLGSDRLQITRSGNDPTKPQYLGSIVLYRFEEPRTYILSNTFSF